LKRLLKYYDVYRSLEISQGSQILFSLFGFSGQYRPMLFRIGRDKYRDVIIKEMDSWVSVAWVKFLRKITPFLPRASIAGVVFLSYP